jgi:hypothetical protein
MKPLPAALVLVLLWTGCRLTFLKHIGFPEPESFDEFSYLLGADTFAHGRLTNPPHPMAKFFESPHEIFHPTYASKYPPGQAMFLALGQRLFGRPFYGVLIGNALMLFTFCLMLYAWVSPPWAIAVSAMFGCVLSPEMYWTNTYSGGSVAAIGGALILLGVGIYRKRAGLIAGAVFAAGAILLFWTRPFEGGVFVLLVLIVFARELWRQRSLSAFVTALCLLAIGASWSCYYNRAVTGNPFLLPYILHVRQYDVAPLFWFMPLRPQPTYSSSRMEVMHGINSWEVSIYKDKLPGWRRIPGEWEKVVRSLEISLRIALLLTLLFGVAWRDLRYRSAAIIAGLFCLILSFETFHFEHYTAPAWAAFALMIAVWAEHSWSFNIRKEPVGIVIVCVVLALPIYFARPRLFVLLQRVIGTQSNDTQSEVSPDEMFGLNAPLIEQLSHLKQKQLVIVRYPSPDWIDAGEWVFNSADIDSQRVVLAHDLGPEQDRALLNYYPDRVALLLTFDAVTRRHQIQPYLDAQSQKPNTN